MKKFKQTLKNKMKTPLQRQTIQKSNQKKKF